MSSISITITVDIPDGSTVRISQAPAAAPARHYEDMPPPEHADADLGEPPICPDHNVEFTWKEGGVSKAGKPYDGFWRCTQKTADGGYCKARPK